MLLEKSEAVRILVHVRLVLQDLQLLEHVGASGRLSSLGPRRVRTSTSFLLTAIAFALGLVDWNLVEHVVILEVQMLQVGVSQLLLGAKSVGDRFLSLRLRIEDRFPSRLRLRRMLRKALRCGAQPHRIHLLFQPLWAFSWIVAAPRLQISRLVRNLANKLLWLLLLLQQLLIGGILQLLSNFLYFVQASELVHVILRHLVRRLIQRRARRWLHGILRLELGHLLGRVLLLLDTARHLLVDNHILLHRVALIRLVL